MPLHNPTVSRAWAAGLVNYTEKQGVDIAALCRQASVADPRGGGGGRLPLDDVVALWQACVEATGDPYFGLHFGAEVRPGTFQVVGYVLMSCPTLGDALEKLYRYQRLISEGGAINIRHRETETWLDYEPRPVSRPFSHHQVEAVIAAFVSFVRWMTGRDFRPLKVLFQHRPEAESQAHERILRGPVVFGSEANRVVVSRETLGWPLVEADPELSVLHESQARVYLDRLGEESSIIQSLSNWLDRRGQIIRVSRAEAAQALGLSEKALQRRLAAAGTTYRAITGMLARERACHLLKVTALSQEEVAGELGFSEVSAFHRAFLRWTGKTPGQWRESRSG